MKINVLLHPRLRTLLVEDGRNYLLIGLPDLAKENYRKS